MEYYPAKEIVPGLWVGSQGDSRSLDFMRRHDIRLVVNCSRNIPSRFRKGQGIKYLRVAVDDAPYEQNEMLRALPAVVPAIDEMLRAGRGVLVHCHAGMQRSAAVAAAYLQEHDAYGRAGWGAKTLGDEKAYSIERLPPPAEVETAITAVWRGNRLLTPIGGGVVLRPRMALDSPNLLVDEDAAVAKAREALKLPAGRWWWD